jgi:hypothetical protein
MSERANSPRATDRDMPTAQATVQTNPMRPPADSPRTAAEAWRVFLSHPSPLILLGVIAAGGAWRWHLGDWRWWDAAIVVGLWAAFPFIEWLIHVHMLHFRPVQIGRFTLDFYLPKTHRRHHAEPWSLHWTFVPRHVHAWVLLSLIMLLWAAGPWRALVLTASLVFLLQGLHYEWVHYLAHISWRPRIAYYERRVLEHRWHHFRNERLWWGVSRGLGDRVLGTAPDVRDVARSDHTTDLGIKR